MDVSIVSTCMQLPPSEYVCESHPYHVTAYVACIFRSSIVGARPNGMPWLIICFISPALPSADDQNRHQPPDTVVPFGKACPTEYLIY